MSMGQWLAACFVTTAAPRLPTDWVWSLTIRYHRLPQRGTVGGLVRERLCIGLRRLTHSASFSQNRGWPAAESKGQMSHASLHHGTTYNNSLAYCTRYTTTHCKHSLLSHLMHNILTHCITESGKGIVNFLLNIHDIDMFNEVCLNGLWDTMHASRFSDNASFLIITLCPFTISDCMRGTAIEHEVHMQTFKC